MSSAEDSWRVSEKPRSVVGLDIGSSAVKAVELKPSGKGYRVAAFGAEPVPPDAIVDGAIIDAGAVADAIRQRVRAQQGVQDQGRLRLALGQRRHRQEDHAAGDDGERSSTSRSTGKRSSTSRSTSRTSTSITRFSTPAPVPTRAAAWKCCSSRRRRKRSATTPSVIAQAGRTPVIVDVDAFALQNAFEVNYGLDAGRSRRAAERRRERDQHQHPAGRPVGVHPRHLDGRQRLHRSGAEGARPAVRVGRAAEEGHSGRRRHVRGGAAGAARRHRERAARNSEDVRLLQGHRRRPITSTGSC